MEHWAKYQCGTSILSQKSEFLFLIIIRDTWSSFKFSEVFSLGISGFVSMKKSLKFSTVKKIYPIAVSLLYIDSSFSATHTQAYNLYSKVLLLCVFGTCFLHKEFNFRDCWWSRIMIFQGGENGWNWFVLEETPVARQIHSCCNN